MRVVDVLGDLEVTLAALGARVVEVVGQALHLVHVDDLVGGAAERLDHAGVLAAEHAVGEAGDRPLLEVAGLERGALAELVPLGLLALLDQVLAVTGLDLGLPQHVRDPGGDRLDDDLGALAGEEAEHVEVAVALGGLGPELAGHLDDRLGLETIDLDLVEARRDLAQRLEVVVRGQLVQELDRLLGDVEGLLAAALDQVGDLAVELRRLLALHDLVHELGGLGERLVSGPGGRLERAHLVCDLVEQVARVERVEHAHEEVEVHLEAGLEVTLLEAALLLEQQHAKAVEAGVTQGQAVLGLVHAEAARPAGAGGQEDVAVDDLLGAHALDVAQVLDELHEVADGEVGRVALPVVAVLLAELEGVDVGGRHDRGLVAERLEHAL